MAPLLLFSQLPDNPLPSSVSIKRNVFCYRGSPGRLDMLHRQIAAAERARVIRE
jgi:hypothetical protein